MADKIQASDLADFPELLKNFKALNVEIAKGVEAMSKISKESIKLDKEMINLQTSQAKLEITQTKVTAETIKLAQQETKLTNETDKAALTNLRLVQAQEKLAASKKQLTETEKQLIANEKLQQKITEQAAGSYGQLTNKLLLLKNQYKQMSEEQRKAGGKQMLNDIQKLDKQVKDFDKSLGVHNRNVGNYGKAWEGVKNLLPTIGFAAIGAGIMSLGKQMFSVRSEFQKYEAVLRNTLGSEDLARQSMSMLQQTAVMLPISVKDLTDSFVKLANRGFIPTQKEIIKLNDIASSTGKGLDMFVEAMLDAQTGEFERLKEFGIKAKSIGDNVTFTFKGQAQTVKKTDEAIKDYLLSLGEMQGVMGASAAIMGTFEGKVSNIGDSWDNMLNNLGKNSEGIITKAIGYVADLVETWAWAAKSIKQIQQEATDEQAAKNYKNALEEITVITEALIKNGEDKAIAQSRAADLYRKQLDENIKIETEAYEKLEAIKDYKERVKLRSRITSLKGELDSVNAHFIKLKEIEINKTKLSSGEIEKRKAAFDKEQQHYRDLALMQQKIMLDLDAESQKNIEDQLNEFTKREEENLQKRIENDQKANDEKLKNNLETGEKLIEQEKKVQEEIQSYKLQIASDAINGLADLQNSFYDQDIAKLNANKEAELKAAGDNAIKKELIERNYAKKTAEIKRKQAIVDKVAALFNIALNTAVAITKASAPPLNALIPYIIAQGVIQAALVAAKPIPKFAKGVRNFEGGFAEVGEAGFEAIRTPQGNVFLTPDKATKMALPKGSDVFTHNETKQLLSDGISIGKFDELIKEQKETRKALSRKSGRELNITPRGWVETENLINGRKIYVDKYFRI